ncbi:MAG: hypothetical protein IKB47_00900 [Clostridia bacterium]|nr:hypothetical protein [Clostridia bacterium]
MIELLKRELDSLDEAILHMEANDHADSKEFSKLIKKKKIIKTALRRICKLEGIRNECNN